VLPLAFTEPEKAYTHALTNACMSPPPTRRQLLTGLGGAIALGTVASTGYHAYTGPVRLVVENYVREPLTADVRITNDDSLVHAATYDLPAFAPTDDRDTVGSGRVEQQIVNRAIRGTVYTVEASTGRHDGVAPNEDETYRVTCTGYTDAERSDGSEKRLTDAISLAIYPADGAGIQLDGPSCGSLWR
jgi:hypothetical protein